MCCYPAIGSIYQHGDPNTRVKHNIFSQLALMDSSKGTLILIGGHEDKRDDLTILKRVAERGTEGKPLVLVAGGTTVANEIIRDYRPVFKDLGVREIRALDIRTREDAYDDKFVSQIDDAGAIFFTGGDQLKLTSQIGETPLFKAIAKAYEDGAVVAGTSAGAAAMPETMIIGGSDAGSIDAEGINMAPGFGLLSGVVVDTHFAQRGRVGRLLAMVASNPKNLGLGIDEDTAIVVRDGEFFVMGSGAVYVIDGNGITYTSLSERRQGIVTVCDVKLHLLAQDAVFDLVNRKPTETR